MADNQPILIKVSNSRQVPLKPEMIIGRQAECDLLLTEGHASRRHARLQLTADGAWLEDLGSANGTYINGSRITARTRLKSGDRLRFDMEEFDFRAPAAPAPDDGRTIFRPQPVRAPEAPRPTEVARPPVHQATVIAPVPGVARAAAHPPEAARPEPPKPVEMRTEMARPAEPVRQAEPPRPIEATRPAELRTREPARPVEAPRPAEPVRPAEPPRPIEATRPAEQRAREPVRPAEAPPPAEPPRSEPAPARAAEPARPAEAPRAEPARAGEVVAAASSGMYKRPGAWADPDAMGEGVNKTKFIDPEQMKQMMKSTPQANISVASIEGPHLQVVSGSRAGVNIKLTVGESGSKEWTIGSTPDREVQFGDSGVSSLHAKIVNEGARWKVLDQMSANGTFVNGKRSNVSYLSPGDRVRFGPVECVFHARAGAGAGSSMGGGGAASSGGTNNKMLVIGAAAFVGTVILLFLLYKFVL